MPPALIVQPLRQPLADGIPPDWASGWGQDEHGIFVEFSLSSAGDDVVTQRLRWIPPGTFTMGSDDPLDSVWRDAKPSHEVTISRGFWLFDTPCTQGLWNAVMDENPSRFVDEQRPVERVDWHTCHQFMQQLAEGIEGLTLALPTEAQWEYACRAGTHGATYAGGMEILGLNNAPVLDKIAWYGGNSGVEFDLDGGEDSTGWSEKQYDHQQAGTRRVGQKQPNAWGLYDMLGNVWEWCDDGPREYSESPVIDPSGATDPGAERVLRGGSWNFVAQLVRSAYRLFSVPGERDDNFGFRCALVQEKSW